MNFLFENYQMLEVSPFLHLLVSGEKFTQISHLQPTVQHVADLLDFAVDCLFDLTREVEQNIDPRTLLCAQAAETRNPYVFIWPA